MSLGTHICGNSTDYVVLGTFADMARQPLDPPSDLGRRISSVIRREMGDRRLSGRAVARAIGKPEAYVRERVKDTHGWYHCEPCGDNFQLEAIRL